MTEKELLTVGEVADILHCGKPTVRRLIKEGKLRAVRPSNADLLPRSNLNAYIRGEQEADKGGTNGEDAEMVALTKDTDMRTARSDNVEAQVKEYKAKQDLTLAEIGLHGAEAFRAAQESVEPREQEIEKNRLQAITMHERAESESQGLHRISEVLVKARIQLKDYRGRCVNDMRSLIAFYKKLDELGAFSKHIVPGKEVKLPFLDFTDELYANRINLSRIWIDIPEETVEQAERDQEPEG